MRRFGRPLSRPWPASCAAIAASALAAAARAEPPAAPIEIEVHGERPPVAASSIRRSEARTLPGTFGDPLRAIEIAPGVTPAVSGLPLFFVRGAPPGNIGFFVDGVRIPLLYHVFLGPAVLHPALLSRVDFFPGAYPARYGRFAGALATASIVDPSEQWRGEASLRLFDAGAMLTGPVAGERGGAFVAARYSYSGLVVSKLTDSTIDFWNYQALARLELDAHQSLSVFGFGASDTLRDELRNAFQASTFHRVDFRYDASPTPETSARIALTLGLDKTARPRGSIRDQLLSGRAALTHEVDSTFVLRAGADLGRDDYELELDAVDLDAPELLPTRADWAGGVYLEAELAPEPWLLVVPGARADYYHSLGETLVGVDPRLSATFRVAEGVRIFHAVGLAHQAPNFIPTVPAAQVGGLEGGLQASVQTSSGAGFDLGRTLTLEVSAFQNLTFDLVDPAGRYQDFEIDATRARERTLGSSVGLELTVKRPLSERLGGLVSYTLSRSTHHREGLDSLSAYDRTHVAHAVASYDFGRRWRGGGRVVFLSGLPGGRSAPEGKVYDQGRAPPFFRLDLRLEKRWLITERAWWGFVAEVQNATLSSDVGRRICAPEGCLEDEVGPIFIPNVGLEGGF